MPHYYASRSKNCFKNPIDYRGRLESERRAWAEQQGRSVEAYMELKAKRPKELKEGDEGVDWFHSKIFDIKSEYHVNWPLLI
jgi:hypothetical protein